MKYSRNVSLVISQSHSSSKQRGTNSIARWAGCFTWTRVLFNVLECGEGKVSLRRFQRVLLSCTQFNIGLASSILCSCRAKVMLSRFVITFTTLHSPIIHCV